MEAEYDQMAEEYDATREAPTPQEVAAVVRGFEGGKTILDVGMGTGRFGKPLSETGLEVTGVDVSRRMLLKARQKGLSRFVLGDAYDLPFRDKAFDSAVIIHVLHVVVDWVRVAREIGRVTKGNVVSILRVPQFLGNHALPSATPAASYAPGAYPVRERHRMWQNERELKAAIPPVWLERIRDEVVTISVEEAFKRVEAKRPLASQLMPPEFKKAMMERIIARSGSGEVHRRIVEDLAVWRADQLASLSPSS